MTQELRIPPLPQVALTEVLKFAGSCRRVFPEHGLGATEASGAVPPLLVQDPRAGHPQGSTFVRTGEGSGGHSCASPWPPSQAGRKDSGFSLSLLQRQGGIIQGETMSFGARMTWV